MMRLLKITILWIAGILVLGHSAIPHHHHNVNQIECGEHHDGHKTPSSFTDNSFCSSHNTHDEICYIEQNTIVKHYQNIQVALIIDIINISEMESCINALSIKVCEVVPEGEECKVKVL